MADGVFVTGTGTEVGKTVVAAAIARTLAADGQRVAVFKPAVTGLDEGVETDHALLRRASGSDQSDEEIAPYRYGPPASPHLAAALAGEEIDPERLRSAAARGRRERRRDRLRGRRRPPRPALPHLPRPRPRRRPRLPARRRRHPRPRHDQPHPADDRVRPRRRPRGRRRRPHPLARGTDRDRALQPRDDRRPGRRRGPHPPPARPRRPLQLAGAADLNDHVEAAAGKLDGEASVLDDRGGALGVARRLLTPSAAPALRRPAPPSPCGRRPCAPHPPR